MLLLARAEPGLFTQRQIELVQTFADQAVIAIENVRLFDEVQARTRDLSEALTYQTASSNILSVIASSPTEVDPALQAIVESACKLCGAYDATVLLKMGNDLHISAHHGPIRTGQSARPINRDWVVGRSVVDKAPVQVSDFWVQRRPSSPRGSGSRANRVTAVHLAYRFCARARAWGQLRCAAWSRSPSAINRLPCCRPSPIRR